MNQKIEVEIILIAACIVDFEPIVFAQIIEKNVDLSLRVCNRLWSRVTSETVVFGVFEALDLEKIGFPWKAWPRHSQILDSSDGWVIRGRVECNLEVVRIIDLERSEALPYLPYEWKVMNSSHKRVVRHTEHLCSFEPVIDLFIRVTFWKLVNSGLLWTRIFKVLDHELKRLYVTCRACAVGFHLRKVGTELVREDFLCH